jgi:hypothetical protein
LQEWFASVTIGIDGCAARERKEGATWALPQDGAAEEAACPDPYNIFHWPAALSRCPIEISRFNIINQ